MRMFSKYLSLVTLLAATAWLATVHEWEPLITFLVSFGAFLALDVRAQRTHQRKIPTHPEVIHTVLTSQPTSGKACLHPEISSIKEEFAENQEIYQFYVSFEAIKDDFVELERFKKERNGQEIKFVGIVDGIYGYEADIPRIFIDVLIRKTYSSLKDRCVIRITDKELVTYATTLRKGDLLTITGLMRWQIGDDPDYTAIALRKKHR